MTRWTCTLVILLAGCPAPAAMPQQPVSPPPPAAGCPTASNVYIASFLTQDEPGGHTGWVLPLHDLSVVTNANQPEYATIDATTAQALGVPTPPASIWMMVPGQVPCRATAGAYYGAVVDSPTPNVTYGVELTGCAPPPKDQQQDAEAIAVVSEQAPTECQVLSPQPVATRLGETDAQKHWQRPTKETPIPPAFAAMLPPHDCQAPGCEMLWSVAQVDVASRPVAWAGAVNWLTIPPNTTAGSQCDWKVETFAGFFVAGPDGKAVKVTEGQDHPLLLSAVLADRTGARLLVAEGPGEYSTYDFLAGGVKLARHLVWLTLGKDATVIDERIGPVCDADADHH
jgi:hypothetical protein